ncbi:MAG: response regulator [Magnetococcales bacterium]|nr:response regulator [Magnetococcales bacterium]
MEENKFRPKVLVVDDVPANVKMLARALGNGYQIHMAINGEDALRIAHSQEVEAILLDVEMPGMDGFEVCRRLQEDKKTCAVPVIFTTGRRSADDVVLGLSLGAYYYLTKPLDINLLQAVVQSAISRNNAHQSLHGQLQVTRCPIFLLMDEARFSIQSMEEAFELAVLLSLTCPDRERVAIGLREILINAVEHGNLGITYEEKTVLTRTTKLDQEIKYRLTLPENRSKSVTVHFIRSEREVRFRIKDCGPGFDWLPFMDFSPERLLDTHGRGIAIASRTSFDRIQFLGTGNEVECVVTLPTIAY